MKHIVYCAPKAKDEKGKKRYICEEILKDFQHNYDFCYLVSFFEKKIEEYFNIAVANNEQEYELARQGVAWENIISNFDFDSNYEKMIQVGWAINTLKLFHDRGYDVEVTAIYSEEEGRIMIFDVDYSRLTKEQKQIVDYMFENAPFIH